jgi:MraZ protein
VARRFRGEFHQKVDPKGRVSIPATFRRVIEACDPDWTEGQRPNLVIVYGDHRRKFLECYTIEAIDDIDRRIDAMPRGTVERKMLERLFHGQSHPTQVDEDGRIVLPQKLREKIDLDETAFFIASGDRFQMWKPETYASEEEARTEAWLDAQGEDFDPMSMLPDLPGAGAERLR